MIEIVEPKIIGIYLARDKGEPMQLHSAVRAIARLGLEGDGFLDRYAAGTGAYSKSKEQKVRDVTLIAMENIEWANQGLEQPFDPRDTRRNILTQGIDLEPLIGEEFSIGNITLMGTEPCTPCRRPEKLSGKPGFMSAFEGLGGIRAQILSNGGIQLGSTIHVS